MNCYEIISNWLANNYQWIIGLIIQAFIAYHVFFLSKQLSHKARLEHRETIKRKAEEIKFGRNNFLEVARKKAIAEEGSNEFIAISRGFFLPDGTKRFRRSIAVPDEAEIINFVAKKLQELHSDKTASAPKKKGKKEEEVPATE